MKILIAQKGRRWNRETHRSIAKVSFARKVESLPAPGSNVPQIKGWPFNERGLCFWIFRASKDRLPPPPFHFPIAKVYPTMFFLFVGAGGW